MNSSLAVAGAIGVLMAFSGARGAQLHRLLRIASEAEPMRDLLATLHTPAPSIAIVYSGKDFFTRLS